MNRGSKLLAVALGLLTSLGAASVVQAPSAQAETGYTLCADWFNCVKITKVGDNKIGKEAGIPSIALVRRQNQLRTPINIKVTQENLQEASVEKSGDLTLGGKYGVADIEAKLGFKVTDKTSVKLTQEETLTVPPGKTGIIECWGVYETYEIKFFTRVPGPNNDEVVGTKYVYKPSPNKSSCTSRLK